jgi:hypothetical protein
MMMIGEAGTDTREQNIISMDDVEMCEAAKYNPNKPIIKWADELMDTVTLDAEGCRMEEDGMTAQGDVEEDTLPEVVEMMPEEEGGMEVALSRSVGMGSDELESVVGVESIEYYPHRHGDGHTLVHSTTTITEKGVELGCVPKQLLSLATITEKGVELDCVPGWSITGEHLAQRIFDNGCDGMNTPLPGPKDISDNNRNITVKKCLGTAHTPYLGAQAEQSKSVINCAMLCTGVQQAEKCTDLRKVTLEPASPNLDRTPGVVDGRVERFGDINVMVAKWESLEQDDNEWKAEEGMRRGNRKLSRRMSELLGIFGEGEGVSMGSLEVGVTTLEDNILHSLSSTTELSSKSDSISALSSSKAENIKTNHIETCLKVSEERTLLAGCDWPVGIPSFKLTTNRERAFGKRKRVTDWESEREVDLPTKKMRGDWSQY